MSIHRASEFRSLVRQARCQIGADRHDSLHDALGPGCPADARGRPGFLGRQLRDLADGPCRRLPGGSLDRLLAHDPGGPDRRFARCGLCQWAAADVARSHPGGRSCLQSHVPQPRDPGSHRGFLARARRRPPHDLPRGRRGHQPAPVSGAGRDDRVALRRGPAPCVDAIPGSVR